MSAPVHDFQESLALSHKYEDAPWWKGVYKRAFVGFRGMYSVRRDGWWQRAGIDRVILLSNSKQVLVDEKVRSHDWGDILLERWSDKARKVPGWMQKNQACDYIAYAFAPTGVCYLLPFLQLRAAWVKHGLDWIARAESELEENRGWRVVPAENKTYVTESIAVPTAVLLSALLGALRITFTPE